MKFKVLNNSLSFKVGNVTGKSFMVHIQYFKKKGFRFIICLNNEKLIKLFKFNQFVIGV